MRDFGLADRYPGKLGDTADGGGIDGHYIWPLTADFSPPYSRPGFCAATAREPQPASLAIRASASLASVRVNSAAGMSWPRRTACPAQTLEKSILPSFSAAAFKGASAVAACGKTGASDEIGPTSRIRRLAMPRAGRPVITLVITVDSSVPCDSAARPGALTRDSGQRR